MSERPEIYQKHAKIKDQLKQQGIIASKPEFKSSQDNIFKQIKTFIKNLAKDIYKRVIIQLNMIDLQVTPYDDKDIMKARKKQILKQFRVYSTIEIKSRRRQKRRQKIINRLYGKGAERKERIAFIVMGLPGSGKSSNLEDKLVEEYGAVKIDSDLPKPMLPEYGNGVGNYIVFEEARYLTHEILKLAIDNGDNLVIAEPGLDYDDIFETIEKLKYYEYEVHLRLVYLHPDKAAKRAIKRFKTKGRFTDPILHYTLGDQPLENYKLLIQEHRDLLASVEAYSSDVPEGNDLILLETLPEPEPIF